MQENKKERTEVVSLVNSGENLSDVSIHLNRNKNIISNSIVNFTISLVTK